MSAPSELIARRAVWLAAISMFFAAALLALTVANLYWQWSRGENLLTGVMFFFVAAFYFGQMLVQLRDRRPQMTIGPLGLSLPTARATPIPWSRIRQIYVKRRFVPTLGGQVDFDVDAETFTTMRFGQRLMGDFIIKRRGFGTAFSVLTQGLDRSTADIEAAIRRYWPPDTPYDADKDD